MEIKFRKKDLIKAMRRIDLTYKKLVERLGARVPGRHPRGQDPLCWWRPPQTASNSGDIFNVHM